jgi:hypothetical protein
MRVKPKAASHLGMLVDGYVPGANFVNVHVVELQAESGDVWAAIPEATARIRPAGPVAFLLRAAAVARFEGGCKGTGEPELRTLSLREGEAIGHVLGPCGNPEALLIERIHEGREVVLTGSHRYASYATNVYLEPVSPRLTRVYNVTRARFFDATALGRAYFRAVRLFHDPLVEVGLGRFKLSAESAVQRVGEPAR